jgi:cation/acetate symporter
LTPPPDRATLALVDYLRNPAARNPQAENT